MVIVGPLHPTAQAPVLLHQPTALLVPAALVEVTPVAEVEASLVEVVQVEAVLAVAFHVAADADKFK